MESPQEWKLVYTKSRCEVWSEANLRNQGFSVLLPRVRAQFGFAPLFPRYLFIGHAPGRDLKAIRSTRGVRDFVYFAGHPVRVPQNVVDEVRARMDANGVVHLDPADIRKPLFDQRERERIRALVRLAEAGFRVKSA